MYIPSIVKTIYKKLFLRPISLSADVEHIHQRIGNHYVKERVVMVGNTRFKVNALKMEATPGTVETVISLLEQFPAHSKILDYGCGQHQSAYLRAMDFNVSSCDILDFAAPNYTKINPQDKRLPFADREFDVTVISEVIEHAESPWELLLEICRITKHSVIVTTPNPMSLKSRQVFAAIGYLYWFTPDIDYHITPIFAWQMEKFCQRHGITLERTYGNHEIFKFTPNKPLLETAEVLIYKLNPNHES